MLAYINAPSYDAWVSVRDTIVSPGESLFNCVEAVDRDFGWFGHFFPSGILVARVSQYVERRHEDRSMFDILPPVG